MFCWIGFALIFCAQLRAAEFSIATFNADVTVPIDHGMMGGLWKSKTVADPLFAKGIVLIGSEKPVVFVSVDWCEIRNEAFDRWRDALAKAVGTTRARVLVSAIQQHEAPVADLEAQRILQRLKLEGEICNLKFHEQAVQRVARVAKTALKNRHPITHIGMGRPRWKKLCPIGDMFYRMEKFHSDVAAQVDAMCSPPMHPRARLIIGSRRSVFGTEKRPSRP